MNTITRLKMEVTSDLLPVITEDGHLYNYYLGRYVNALNTLGVSLSADEFTAVQELVNNAVNHGWVGYVDYLFPFLGTKDVPASGWVPLIDRKTNYDITQFNYLRPSQGMNYEDNFSYDENDRIVSYGELSDRSVPKGSGIKISKKVYNNNEFCAFACVQSVRLPYRTSNYHVYVDSDNRQVRSLGRYNDESYKDNAVRWSRNATNPSQLRVLSQTPIDQVTRGDRYLSYLIGVKGSEYTQTIMEADGTTIRNYHGNDGDTPADVSCYPALGDQHYDSTTGIYTLQAPKTQVYLVAYLNTLINTSTALILSEDIRQFEVSLGRCVVPEPEEE